jgi:hypothetical protein
MSIKRLATAYNQFQDNFGNGLDADYETIIESLFSPTFKKIANGNQLVGNRGELNTQLGGVREMACDWNIDPTFIIPSDDGKSCTFRYKINTEKAGTFDVLAVMGSANGELIDNIDEVYYQIES